MINQIKKNISIVTPDRWIVINVGDLFYKVIALFEDDKKESFRINSGIYDVKEQEDSYAIYGVSGSIYFCKKSLYGLNGYGEELLDYIQQTCPVEIEDVKTIDDFKEIVKNSKQTGAWLKSR